MGETKNIAIIPARSGSKGLKNKNIKLLDGKPLLAYSVEAALAAGIYDEVYVSTDSREYADIAVKYGASVPFLRSSENAGDKASSWEVVREALKRYEELGKTFDMVTLLQPTTPLRTSKDITNAYRFYREKQANAVVSVCEVEHSPLWSNTLPESLSMEHFIRKELADLPRQQLSTFYRINGGIYMVDTGYFMNTDNIYQSGCYAYVMDTKKSVDIDNELDFIIAEAILRTEKKKGL